MQWMRSCVRSLLRGVLARRAAVHHVLLPLDRGIEHLFNELGFRRTHFGETPGDFAHRAVMLTDACFARRIRLGLGHVAVRREHRRERAGAIGEWQRGEVCPGSFGKRVPAAPKEAYHTRRALLGPHHLESVGKCAGVLAREQLFSTLCQCVRIDGAAHSSDLALESNESRVLEDLEVPPKRVRREAEANPQLLGGEWLLLSEGQEEVPPNSRESGQGAHTEESSRSNGFVNENVEESPFILLEYEVTPAVAAQKGEQERDKHA